MLLHQSNGTLTDFRRKFVVLAHGSIFSKVGASSKPGAIQIAYFTDPKLNLGGRGKSRQEIFEKNGTSGDEILRHPHFLKHLEYFVCGPDLPAEAIEKFKCEASGGHLGGSDIIDLTPYCRSCVRQNRLEPHRAADEFFKLAVECGAMPGFAENLLKSIRAVKLR